MGTAHFNQAIRSILGDDSPRVWSLLVTIFGDLAIAPGARLSGAGLNAVTAALGIKPEATRVALHRLRKEGWIESHRTGRTSAYGLTHKGRAETRAASPRVYAVSSPDMPIYLVIDPSSATQDPIDAARTIRVLPQAVLTATPARTDTAWVFPLDPARPIPDWVTEKECPPDIQRASGRLANSYNSIAQDARLDAEDPLHRTALRIAALHEWRRIVLKVPDMPDTVFPAEWKGAECRRLLNGLLSRFPAPSEPEFNAFAVPAT